ncbi:hypothetical protein [Nocardioides halotolerans]|jgi:hypothetical protein|uniref:hypothetical protein n=1 Tax=Nocardioides halotolerans TaxID=433660 RepID=UPI00048EF6F7|nr:hypothetical protein [Nocardioides halotolerans]
MFQPTQRELQSVSEALGWSGICVGPVRQMGTDVWPVISMGRSHGSRVGADEVELVGCLVAGEASAALVASASLFAGYAPRAIVISGEAPLEVMVDAALLDQGVVAVAADMVEVLGLPGPRVQPRTREPRGSVAGANGAIDVGRERQEDGGQPSFKGEADLKAKALAALLAVADRQ